MQLEILYTEKSFNNYIRSKNLFYHFKYVKVVKHIKVVLKAINLI